MVIPKKFTTENEEEDMDFFNYQKAIEEYNDDGYQKEKTYESYRSEYERGTVIQRALDPYFGSGKDENGTTVCNMQDGDFAFLGVNDEKRLKAEYDGLIETGETWEMEDDKAAKRVEMLKYLESDESKYSLEQWDDIIKH